jgi:hypothetical protein
VVDNWPTKEAFLKCVENHSIEAIKDEGVYRHIRFSNNGSSIYQFDLLTWPGHLCITGDCGSYLFARIYDMFQFFTHSQNNELEINAGYWSEKVLAESVFGEGIREFSVDKFRENVIECATYDLDEDDEDYEDQKQAILEEIDELLHCSDEWECIEAYRNFDSDNVNLSDFWEYRHTVYTWNYIWNLYAIVWGIQEYGEYKKKNEVAS